MNLPGNAFYQNEELTTDEHGQTRMRRDFYTKQKGVAAAHRADRGGVGFIAFPHPEPMIGTTPHQREGTLSNTPPGADAYRVNAAAGCSRFKGLISKPLKGNASPALTVRPGGVVAASFEKCASRSGKVDCNN
jgi:hypothetical protein